MRNVLSQIAHWWPLALVVALLSVLFGRRRGPSGDDVKLHQAVANEARRRAQERRDHEIAEITADVDRQIDDLRDSGDDGFMDRANEHDRAGDNDGR